MAGKFEIAKDFIKEALEIPGVKSAAENAIAAAEKFLYELMPKSPTELSEKIEKALKNTVSDIHLTGNIAPRGLSTEISAESTDTPLKLFGFDYTHHTKDLSNGAHSGLVKQTLPDVNGQKF